MNLETPLLLASLSPQRKRLMDLLGVPFIQKAPLVDEDVLKKNFSGPPQSLALHLARAKAQSLMACAPQGPILGGDQVLLFKDTVVGKSESIQECVEKLQLLQGQIHTLYTALALYFQGEWMETQVSARMNMHSLTLDEIQNYVKIDPAPGCVGGYRIESKGAWLFRSIETTDYFSIVGLPVLKLTEFLRKIGQSPLAPNGTENNI